jgi:hypothetical protein
MKMVMAGQEPLPDALPAFRVKRVSSRERSTLVLASSLDLVAAARNSEFPCHVFH